MKVTFFNEKSTNRPKHNEQTKHENTWFLQNYRKMELQNMVLYKVLHEPMLSSLAKYDEFTQLKHVDFKKQFFRRGIYTGSPGSVATSSPNRRLEERLGRVRGRGWRRG